ncbi:hypothetical protein GGS26DRAFT_470783 [Hypomontagnella submonticulosa]|nr:hypothetical protein GGS26DRAFT_470783 [Hypomontagnella submonticulosa]
MLVDTLVRRLSSRLRKSIPPYRQQDAEEDEHTGEDEDDEDFEEIEEPLRIPAYPYRELEGTEIRLLRIVPGTGTIECLLHQMPLPEAEAQYFYALSYVWGDPAEAKTIMIEGQPFHITENLYEALHQFRERPYDIGYPRDYFWVDAICINQADLDERSRQVPRMVDIYHAGHVVIWLGHPGKPLPDSLSKKLVRIARSSQPQISPDEAVRVLFKKTESMWDDWEPVDDDDNTIVRAEFGDAYNATIKMLADILRRPWFQRVWTIQEACLDVYPRVYVGRHSVHLGKLIDIWKILVLEHKSLLLCVGSKRLDCVDRVDRLYRSGLFDGKDNPKRMQMAEVLATLLRVTGAKMSSDPRDQLYGLLGLLKFFKEEDLPAELIPDYRLPYQEVYWNYAAFLFQSVGDLNLLDCSNKQLQDVPSWVPDFRFISHGPRVNRGETVHVSSDKRILYVKGCVLGTFRGFLAGCDQDSIWPTAKAIPIGLPTRFREVEEHILKPSGTIRGMSVEEVFTDLMKSMTRIIDEEGDESFYQVYRRLSKFAGGKRPWYAKKKAANIKQKEMVITGQLSCPLLLLKDGTILRMKNLDAKIRIDDQVCLFKGASNVSLVRASEGNYTFLGVCEVRSGPLQREKFDDDFWIKRDIQEFGLI